MARRQDVVPLELVESPDRPAGQPSARHNRESRSGLFTMSRCLLADIDQCLGGAPLAVASIESMASATS